MCVCVYVVRETVCVRERERERRGVCGGVLQIYTYVRYKKVCNDAECEYVFARMRQGEWCFEGNFKRDGVRMLDEQWRRRREFEARDSGDGDGRARGGCGKPPSSATFCEKCGWTRRCGGSQDARAQRE